MCVRLHFDIGKEIGAKLNKEHSYDHVRKSIKTNNVVKVRVSWNQQAKIDKTTPSNKPDIIICDNLKRTYMLIEVTISGYRNVIKKESEKILKCKDLTIETQRMWNIKTKVIT